jgi:hypothetical protein
MHVAAVRAQRGESPLSPSTGQAASPLTPRLELAASDPDPASGGLDAERTRSLRSLCCSSDGGRGRGVPVTNLAHSASLNS